jgi:hypothetical protein
MDRATISERLSDGASTELNRLGAEHGCRPLSWAIYPNGTVTGTGPADYGAAEMLAVLAIWSQVPEAEEARGLGARRPRRRTTSPSSYGAHRSVLARSAWARMSIVFAWSSSCLACAVSAFTCSAVRRAARPFPCRSSW